MKYMIPAGTKVMVYSKDDDAQWNDYTIEEELTFDRGEVAKATITFRWLDTCLMAWKKDVVDVRDK